MHDDTPKKWRERAESYLADCEDLSLLMESNNWTAQEASLHLDREAQDLIYQALQWSKD